MNHVPTGSLLTQRQQSELAYHAQYVRRHRDLERTPVSLDVCADADRRPWNAYWFLYDRIREMLPLLRGKRILVPGCGFGEDCIRLAYMLDAEIYGIDLSPEVLEVAAARISRFYLAGGVTLTAMPCENLDFPDNFFDGVVLTNILHHVDVPRTMEEVRRVAKPGAVIAGLEMYTHSWIQNIRDSAFVSNVLYPRLRKQIYGTDQPYITPDERKIDEAELDYITSDLKNCQVDFFGIFSERLFSGRHVGLARADRLLNRLVGPFGRLAAGRAVFSGQLEKTA